MGIAELPTPRLTLSFWGRSRVPLVLQSETSECALACLSMVAAHHGLNMDLATLRRRWTPSPRGTTLAQMMAMAADLHLVPRALRLELNQIARLRLPAILHWDLDHFVVLEEASARGAWVVDPAIGRRRLPLHEVSRHFTGIALELRPAEHFRKRRDVERLPLASFFARAQGLGTALGRILVLSLALQVFVVLAPLFGQIVIDEIVVSGDRPLLTVLGVGFLLIVGIHACLSGVRGWMVAVLGASLQLGWGARLFHHLIRLPLCWFERRHMGDVVSRFQSIRAIEALVAGTMVEAVVDGLMACTTLAVMLLYSPVLAGISMLAVTLYLAVRLALYGPLRRASTEALVLGARADSLFMESVRAILPLKNHGAEAVRECAWQNRRAQALDADLHVRQLEILRQIANTAVFGAEGVVILWLGAILVLSGEMTAGMLVAFVAYKGQFASRAALLVDSWLDVRLVSVHLERLADIALEPGDPGTQAAIPLRVRGALAARDLWFRYAGTEPYVVAGVDLDIAAGECVAITGPSGMGKTTLVKLLMGLLEPSCGSILVDGGVLRSGSVGSYRRQVAAVMQDDVLLSGTLADNISLFDADRDQRWMETCAELAAVHEDIMQMPMGYLTCVGDMGSMLSGGQRQRICLARALYSRPRILFLDEATSHVDPTVEYRIFEGLRELGMTRVVVAHRQETLCAADRVIALQRRDGDP